MKTRNMFGLAAVAAVALCGCVCDKSCGCGKAPVSKHVVMIGVDGCGARWIPWDAMPNLKALRDGGLYTVGRCHRPTASAINWKSIFSGLSPEIHGFTQWNSAKPDIAPPPSAMPDGKLPDLFAEVRRQMPDAYTASIYTWDGVGNCHATNAANVVRFFGGKQEEYPTRDAAVFEEGVKQLANSPKLMLLYQGGVDSFGHKYGWGSEEFTNACKRTDANIGKFMAALKRSGMGKDTTVVFVADHGGLGKKHGGVEDIRVLEIPFIVNGPAVKGLRLHEPFMLEDAAPTILSLLGCDTPDTMRGRNALRSRE